ncbi:MAG: ATP-binding protein [Myxococcota bacterium]|nr:ATP-binding protein [Myxococcota bacterium]
MALEHARFLAPVLAIAVGWYTFAADLIALSLTPFSFVLNVCVTLTLAVLWFACRRQWFAPRHGHVLLGALWWLVTGASVQGLLTGAQSEIALLVMLEMLAIAVLLHTRFVVASLLVLDVVFVPIMVWTELPGWPMYLGGAAGAQFLGIVCHLIFKHAMHETELRRRAQADVSRTLDRKITELAQSRAARDELSSQIAATQRIEATGTLAASFAHEMNNILAGITTMTSMLARRTTGALQADYKTILAESQRGADLTRGLLAFSRRDAQRREPRSFDEIVQQCCDMLGRTLPRTIELDLRLGAPVDVSCDIVQIGQLLVNLALNAAEAMGSSGTIVVETDCITIAKATSKLHPGSYARLRVRDRGNGMDAATQARAFDPFFTTKPLGKGCGLGLSTAWGIARSHDGTIELDSTVGEGTTATVYMPVVPVSRTDAPALLSMRAP